MTAAAIATHSSFHHTPEGELVRVVHTTWTTVLSAEVYSVTSTGLEMYRGMLLEEPHLFDLLAQLDEERRSQGPRPWTPR